MTRCREDSGDDAVDGLLEIRIVENDIRGLAAELQRDMLDAACRKLINVLARSTAAGEGDFGDIRMRDEWLSNFISVTGHDIHDTWRKAGLFEQLTESESRDGGELRGLPYDGISCGECRSELPRGKHQWRIPGGDRRHHTERLLAREVEHTWLVAGNDAAFDLVRKAAKVVEPLRKVMKLCPHFEKELSVVGGLNFREPVCFTGHDIAEPPKQGAPRSGGQLSPGISVKGRSCRRDGTIDILLR